MSENIIKNNILYIDQDIIIINKPSGMFIGGKKNHKDNLEIYLETLCFENKQAPILAHRLDKDTSGCLILGRHKKSLSSLGKMFMSKRIKKTYWAVVQNFKLLEPQGTINISLQKQSLLKHHWHMEPHPGGKTAITDYKVIGQEGTTTILQLHPYTGRTHQLRVHCMAIGSAIIGDKIYGENSNDKMLHLHARAISIPRHDQTPLKFTAPVPIHMQWAFVKCGYIDY